MSDYQGMDKKKWQDKYKSMLSSWFIIQDFYLPLLLHSSVYCLHFLIKSKKKVKAEAKLQND